MKETRYIARIIMEETRYIARFSLKHYTISVETTKTTSGVNAGQLFVFSKTFLKTKIWSRKAIKLYTEMPDVFDELINFLKEQHQPTEFETLITKWFLAIKDAAGNKSVNTVQKSRSNATNKIIKKLKKKLPEDLALKLLVLI